MSYVDDVSEYFDICKVCKERFIIDELTYFFISDTQKTHALCEECEYGTALLLYPDLH